MLTTTEASLNVFINRLFMSFSRLQTFCQSRCSTMKKIALIFLVFFVLCGNVKCFKILGIFPSPSKSHYYVGNALMKGLAEKGHEVTVISPFKEKESIKNYREVILEKTVEMFKESEFLFE